jgi:hypothetical protein
MAALLAHITVRSGSGNVLRPNVQELHERAHADQFAVRSQPPLAPNGQGARIAALGIGGGPRRTYREASRAPAGSALAKPLCVKGQFLGLFGRVELNPLARRRGES